MADEKEKEKKEEPAPVGNSKKKKIIIIAAAAVVLLGGGAAAFLMMSKGKKEPAHEEGHGAAKTETAEHGEKHDEGGEHKEGSEAPKEHAEGEGKGAEGGHAKEKEEAKEHAEAAPPSTQSLKAFDIGETFTFKPFHLNLGNPLENRYVRLEVAVEYKNGPEQKTELEARTVQLRDAIISVISRKTREFLLGPDGKDQIRLEILNRINQYMDKKIEAVYIADILVE